MQIRITGVDPEGRVWRTAIESTEIQKNRKKIRLVERRSGYLVALALQRFVRKHPRAVVTEVRNIQYVREEER
jgi:hypothetical protein